MYLVVILIAVAIPLIHISLSRVIKEKNRQVGQAMEEFDILFQHRQEIIPSLFGLVKAPLQQHLQSLADLTKLRGKAMIPSLTFSDKIIVDAELRKALLGVIVVAKDHPQLAQHDKFLAFVADYQSLEDKMDEARKEYNRKAAEFNGMFKVFPMNFFASLINLRELDTFGNN